jgi:hypothetical protein
MIPQIFSSYMALTSHIIDLDPSNYKEVVEKQVWRYSMMEEYQFIMKNDVWEVVPRTKRKFVVNSRWIYKIKHVVDGSIEKRDAWFMARVSLKKREWIMMRHSLP